jgi:antitoxin component YwqK of YwqJK toxin-antitoxin module
MNDTLEMDGTYNELGKKDGIFIFYYPNGQVQSQGHYHNNFMKGEWEYFTRDGDPKMRVEYDGDGINFTVHEFRDSTGKMLTKDGTGEFLLPMNYKNDLWNCILQGQFRNGKRHGNWKYLNIDPRTQLLNLFAEEKYDNGELKKGTIYFGFANSNYRSPTGDFYVRNNFQLNITENFDKDPLSFRTVSDLETYLQTGEISRYHIEDTSSGSMVGILRTLNAPSIVNRFRDPLKLYKGEVIFTLGDSGTIKDIEINGNLSENEKTVMQFILKKFDNIRELDDKNEMSPEHKIYFFSLVTADFLPLRDLGSYPETEFVFSPWPYLKLVETLKKIRKKLKY